MCPPPQYIPPLSSDFFQSTLQTAWGRVACPGTLSEETESQAQFLLAGYLTGRVPSPGSAFSSMSGSRRGRCSNLKSRLLIRTWQMKLMYVSRKHGKGHVQESRLTLLLPNTLAKVQHKYSLLQQTYFNMLLARQEFLVIQIGWNLLDLGWS